MRMGFRRETNSNVLHYFKKYDALYLRLITTNMILCSIHASAEFNRLLKQITQIPNPPPHFFKKYVYRSHNPCHRYSKSKNTADLYFSV